MGNINNNNNNNKNKNNKNKNKNNNNKNNYNKLFILNVSAIGTLNLGGYKGRFSCFL